MTGSPLRGKTVLITGAARRVGRGLALACAHAGADIIIHYGSSEEQAHELHSELSRLGVDSWTIQADLQQPAEVTRLMEQALAIRPLYGLVNNAAIFEPLSVRATTAGAWDRHMAINLTAPFLLAQGFARQVAHGQSGRIVNLVDWRALRPGPDHFPYTMSKAALAALTRSLAIAFAPDISVNALALGAILPPVDGAASPEVVEQVPAHRWGEVKDAEEALLFLLAGPSYITGEIIHVDGGRHLV